MQNNNQEVPKFFTPLMEAVLEKDTDKLYMLLEDPALDLNESLKFSVQTEMLGEIPAGTTALHIAVRTGYLRGAQWLTYQGATQTQDCYGQTPLKLAHTILKLIRNKPDQIKKSHYYTEKSEVPTEAEMQQVIKFLNYEHIPRRRKLYTPSNTAVFFRRPYLAATAVTATAVVATALAAYKMSCDS